MIIEQLLFYTFAILLIGSAIMVISSSNPIQGALFLVLAFVSAAGLWLMLQSEFLAWILILVYVGAVMTLFLFVVMMMNLDKLPDRTVFKRYLPLGIVIVAIFVTLVILATRAKNFALANAQNYQLPADYSNVRAIGAVLYTQYFYAFEIAAVILLVSIVAAIALAFRGRRPQTRSQKIAKQINTRREDAVKIISMDSERRQS